MINRIIEKPGYKVIFLGIILILLFNFWQKIYVTAYVDIDGYVYATKTGITGELNYIDYPVKLTRANYVNFDYFEYDKQ